MEEKKSIYDCFQELKQRAISELKDAVRNAGNTVVFSEEDAPVVIVNFCSYFPHPADVRITEIRLNGEHLDICGKEKAQSGGADYYEDEQEIDVEEIVPHHICFITDDIIEGHFLPTWNPDTGLCSDGSWCSIDKDEQLWEYQSDANDDETYESGSYEVDDDKVTGYDGTFSLSNGVMAALRALGYKLDL